MNTPTTINLTGRVTADLTLQTSQNGKNTPYVQFSLAVNKGYGDKEHTNFYQCILYGDAAQRIVNAKVKKGSLIYLTGDLDLVEFTKRDGTPGFSARVSVYDWSYLPSGHSANDQNSAPASNTGNGYDSYGYPPRNGGQNGLPNY